MKAVRTTVGGADVNRVASMSPSELPLVMLGPGGDFLDAYALEEDGRPAGAGCGSPNGAGLLGLVIGWFGRMAALVPALRLAEPGEFMPGGVGRGIGGREESDGASLVGAIACVIGLIEAQGSQLRSLCRRASVPSVGLAAGGRSESSASGGAVRVGPVVVSGVRACRPVTAGAENILEGRRHESDAQTAADPEAHPGPREEALTRAAAIRSRYHRALAFGIRSPVAWSTQTRPNRWA